MSNLYSTPRASKKSITGTSTQTGLLSTWSKRFGFTTWPPTSTYPNYHLWKLTPLSHPPHHSRDIFKEPSITERRGRDNNRKNNEFETQCKRPSILTYLKSAMFVQILCYWKWSLNIMEKAGAPTVPPQVQFDKWTFPSPMTEWGSWGHNKCEETMKITSCCI